MKSKKILVISIIVNIIILFVVFSLANSNIDIIGKRQIIKEMTEGEYESKLTELNKSHEDYALQVQQNKQKISTAISNQKVETSADATIDEIVTNIGKILQVRTSDATATVEDIAEGKTAYVNGNLLTGTAITSNNPSLLWQNSYSASSTSFAAQTINLDLSNYDAVIVSLVRVHTSTTRWYFVIPIGTSQVVNMYMNGDETNVGGNTWYRLITTSTNGITFGNPLNDASCNYGMLPCEIYGLSNFIQ